MGGRRKRQASSGKGKEKEVREDGKEPARDKRKRRGEENEVGEDGRESSAAKKVRREDKESPAKEKQKHMGMELVEVREEGEEKTAANSVGPQFFKVFFTEQSTEILKIPLHFHQHLKEQPTGSVSLKGPSGNVWPAVLTLNSEGLCFEQGWKEFVIDHSIRQGDFLVFTYDGCSRFSVTTFCSLGIVNPRALVVKPTNNIVVKVEDDERIQGDMDAGGTSEIVVPPLEEGNRITGKRTRGLDDVLVDGNASKRHSSVAKKAEKRLEAIDHASKDVSTIANIKKDASFSLLDESTACNKTRIREKSVPRLGKFVLRRSRQPVVISQRRPVTQEEKDLALRRAKEFKSKNPFSLQIMMESYVYVGFFMNIPCEFVRESLPRTNKKMTLWDPLGKPWEVNYVYYSDRSVGSFSGGWGKFSLGNNLEKFDVCVFELFKEDNIKVHIYRVVPEITPLLRAANKE